MVLKYSWLATLAQLFVVVIVIAETRGSPGDSGELPERCYDNRCLILESERLTMEEAEEFCEDHHEGHLVTVESLAEHETLTDFLEDYSDVTEIWIGAKREKKDDWEWESRPGSKPNKGKDRDRRFAGRRSRRSPDSPSCMLSDPEGMDDHTPIEYCAEDCSDYNSYMCVKAAESQPCPTDQLSCSSYCMSFEESRTTWYTANQECTNQGAALYNPLQSDLNLAGCLLKEFPEQDEDLTERIKDTTFWVDGISVKWVWVTGGDVKRTFWYPYYPRENDKCVRHVMRESEGGWKDEECTRKLRFVCETEEDDDDATTETTSTTVPTTDRTTSDYFTDDDDTSSGIVDEETVSPSFPKEEESSPEDDSSSDNHRVLYLALGAVGVLVLIVILLTTALLFFIKRHRKTKKEKELMDGASAASSQAPHENHYDVIPALRAGQSEGSPRKPYESVNVSASDPHPYTYINAYEQIQADYEDIRPTQNNNSRFNPPEVNDRSRPSNLVTESGTANEYADRLRPTDDEDIVHSSGYLHPEPSVKHQYVELVDSNSTNSRTPSGERPGKRGPSAGTTPSAKSLRPTSPDDATVQGMPSQYIHPGRPRKNEYLEVVDPGTADSNQSHGTDTDESHYTPVSQRVAEYLEIVST